MTADSFPPFDITRRTAVLGSLATVALLTGSAGAQDAPLPGADLFGDGAAFDRARLVDHARELAKRPFAAPNSAMPDGLTNLNFEQYSGIRNRPERAIWAGEPAQLVLEPLHRGFIYASQVHVAVIEGGQTRRIPFSPAAYDYGKLPAPPSTAGDIGFSGVRIMLRAPDGQERFIAAFQGASFLRSLAKGQTLGVISRALSLKTADPRGEEFPAFRALWIEKPAADDLIVVHALLDSQSVTGVFTYTIRAGEVTLIDTETAIFPRVALDNYGLAGMQGSYLFGWTDRRTIDDTRTAVYEVAGVQMANGNGEWIWRPVNNPKQLQISSFSMQNPRGFGLVMRDRAFSSFNDHDARYDLRPSLWIEPIGEWQAGAVQLVEIPSDNEVHDNIIAQWRPKEPLAAGSSHFSAYRQHWCWSPPERPNLAMVIGTRIGRAQQRRRRFVIDYAGDRLAGLKLPDVQPAVWSSNNGISNIRMIQISPERPLRITFDLDPGNETSIELRLALMLGTEPVSETWLYRWTA